MKTFLATILLCLLTLPSAGQVRALTDTTYIVPRALLTDYVWKSFDALPACESLSLARHDEIEALRATVVARNRVIAFADSVNLNQRQALDLCAQTEAALDEAFAIAKRKQRSVRFWKTTTVVSLAAVLTTLLVK